MSRTRVSLLLAALVVPLASAATAKQQCTRSCRQECEQARCTGLGEWARRTCVRTCKRTWCAPIGTFAWVDNEFYTVFPPDGRGEAHQRVMIRRGNCDPVKLMELTVPQPVPDPLGFAEFRIAPQSAVVGGVQRFGLRPDGMAVALEVSNATRSFPLVPLPQEGFFFVNADGSDLRYLGPPSREPLFVLEPVDSPFGTECRSGCHDLPWCDQLFPNAPERCFVITFPSLNFSHIANFAVFTDLGTGPAGETATQVWMLDLDTGVRTPVTQGKSALPSAMCPPGLPSVFSPHVSDDTVRFMSCANPDGLNPNNQLAFFTVKTDGADLQAIPVPPSELPRDLRGFGLKISGGGTATAMLNLQGRPWNPVGGVPASSLGSLISEVFFVNGEDVLQLTNFHRVDTIDQGLSPSGQRAFFIASADPLRTNRTNNCQLFSIDTLGAHLRQLTHFSEGEDPSVNGCINQLQPGHAGPAPGCVINSVTQDGKRRAILFDSSCNLSGTNPNPDQDQVFIIRTDGSGLRQLTQSKGRVNHPDGSVTTELSGPWEYRSD